MAYFYKIVNLGMKIDQSGFSQKHSIGINVNIGISDKYYPYEDSTQASHEPLILSPTLSFLD